MAARNLQRVLTAVLLVLTLFCIAPSLTASAAPLAYGGSHAGNAALSYVQGHYDGHYVWGGDGPGYDCSGLVYEGFRKQGIVLPRTSYAMVHSSHMHRISLSDARRGDVLAWGPIGAPYHVGFKTIWSHGSFEARSTRDGVGWFSTAYFAPSAAYRVW
jgi:hypothetical protein